MVECLQTGSNSCYIASLKENWLEEVIYGGEGPVETAVLSEKKTTTKKKKKK